MIMDSLLSIIQRPVHGVTRSIVSSRNLDLLPTVPVHRYIIVPKRRELLLFGYIRDLFSNLDLPAQILKLLQLFYEDDSNKFVFRVSYFEYDRLCNDENCRVITPLSFSVASVEFDVMIGSMDDESNEIGFHIVTSKLPTSIERIIVKFRCVAF